MKHETEQPAVRAAETAGEMAAATASDRAACDKAAGDGAACDKGGDKAAETADAAGTAAEAVMPESMTIEEAFRRLDEMAEQLESGDVSLEDSFRLYEKGMRMLKSLNDRIDRVEKKMQQIDDEGQMGDFE